MPNYLYMTTASLENDFIRLDYLYMTMDNLENDFISPIIYTWPWLTKKTTSFAQLFIHVHGLLRKRLH